MFKTNKLNRLLIIAIAQCCVLVLAWSMPLAAQNHKLFFFDEQVELELNTGKVAIFSASSERASKESLINNDLQVVGIESFPIPGWQFVDINLNEIETHLAETLGRFAECDGCEFASPVFIDKFGGPFIPTRDILVRFEPTIGRQNQLDTLAALNLGTVLDADWANMPGAYRIRSNARNGLAVLEQANALAIRPDVRWAEPDMIFSGRAEDEPNDPFFDSCWGLHNTGQIGACQFNPGVADVDMDAPEAWDITFGDEDIKVLILESGVQTNHPDLNQVPGEDFTGQSNGGGPINECEIHGTAVAGCVSAIANNNLGTVGVAPGCRTASARVFIANTNPCDGTWNAQFSWGVDALAWAESIGVRVSNNSNAYGGSSSALEDKYSLTRDNGMVHFASAGNNSSSVIAYPARIASVNSVAALHPSGNLSSFSNYGTGLAFSAPGEDILSTDRTGSVGYSREDYVCINGTSFASPYAAGVAALVLSVNPSLTAAEVEQIMQESCVDLGAPGYDTIFGWGNVNAFQAVTLAAPEPPTHPTKLNVIDGSIATGGLGELLESDGNLLSVYPDGEFGSDGAPITLEFVGVASNDTPAAIAVTIDSLANTIGLEATVSFWNFNTQSWDVVGSSSQPYLSGTATTFEGNPTDHVQAETATVMTRYQLKQSGPVIAFPYRSSIDSFIWETERR